MTKNTYFISGIDTNCGKTIATGILARYLLNKGKNVISQKLIQTGCEGLSEDIVEHRKIMNCNLFPEDLNNETCIYNLKFPASPHLSAEKEKIIIDIEKIKQNTQILSNKFEIVLIEGAGGLFVPITRNKLIIDYIKENNYPLILVTTSKLGTINQCLLNIHACYTKKINLKAVLYNTYFTENEEIANDSFDFIKQYLLNHYPNAEIFKFSNPDNVNHNDHSKIFDL